MKKQNNRKDILNILSNNQKQLEQMGVASLSLFGSVARNEASESSDIDLLVEFNRRVGLFHFIRVKQYLEDILGVNDVDLVMPDALIEELKENILKEAILVA
ncbi:MAG: nucleotidyltransferase family protein [Candidatus Hatepunaea meridiana]|nr:nucleotidyltransferase family protein [Candidatus Hatepunaea meridiana]